VPVLPVMLSPGAQAAQLRQKFLQEAKIAKPGKWLKSEGDVGLVTADF